MSTDSMGVFTILEGMLDKGLPFVAAYLEKRFHRPILITDSIGRIHYPDIPGTPAQLDDIFVKLPTDLHEDEYMYQEQDQSLYYCIGQNRASAYVIVKDLPGNMVSQAVSLCNSEVKLAIKLYFTNLEKMRGEQAAFKKELAEYLFFKGNSNIRDILKLSERDLEIDKPYLVTITEADEPDSETDWQMLCSVTSQHLKRVNLEIIPIAWTNCMLAIFPASFKKDT